MGSSKVTLSPEEWALVSNPDIILTKNAIIEKVYQMLGEMAEYYANIVQQLPEEYKSEWMNPSPKIARGEQYQELPWVMLDYPRYYADGNTKGIRTFFWWGHGFSIHLLLQGTYCNQWKNNAHTFIHTANENWWMDVGTDPWQHHFREAAYIPIHRMQLQQVNELNYIKYSCWFPLTDWEQIPEKCTEIFKRWIQIPG
ncbi:MAG: hypothetical protein FGM61_02760 [Sediminibacterium sp.]|nr:hypothetical protein [Sediminibacterium sp.]